MVRGMTLNTEMNFAAKERTDRKIRDLRAIPWRFIAHPPGEFSDFFKFLTLCSLRSFAANHFPLQDYPLPISISWASADRNAERAIASPRKS
jgi:hypothetical protein